MAAGEMTTEPASEELNESVAQALRAFAKKNRPANFQARFATCDPTPTEDIPFGRSVTEQGLGGATVQADQAAPNSPRTLAPTLVKFDIFDNCDEERLAEFENLARETKANSNYTEFSRKSKKVDPNKYATVSTVQQDEAGGRVLS
eukprot:TRINITY_DN7692_c0_g1_i1.p1 TRINITY_DN7692_c0_g1~~TRINITY_DN7692_c0_g1_i1.p1  ORF type:complete len:146 (+),score=27.53 TRINITY_DN7692_c0_g1_i1:109-546(+)